MGKHYFVFWFKMASMMPGIDDVVDVGVRSIFTLKKELDKKYLLIKVKVVKVPQTLNSILGETILGIIRH